MNDKVKITIELERLPNGVINTHRSIEGEGFHFFEIVGLLEIAKQGLVQESWETAKKINEQNPDKPTKIQFVKSREASG